VCEQIGLILQDKPAMPKPIVNVFVVVRYCHCFSYVDSILPVFPGIDFAL